jgi:hypothetical protein
MSTQQHLIAQPAPSRPKRKLRPEVAARLTAQAVKNELEQLYAKAPADLTPEELRKMKAAFFLGI